MKDHTLRTSTEGKSWHHLHRFHFGEPTGQTPIASRIVLSLVAAIVLGTLVLMMPGIAVNGRLTFWEASFTATSALTVTGLSIITPATDLTLMGKVVLISLIQIGGVGFMYVAIIGLMLLGRQINIADRMRVTHSIGLESSEEILGLLKKVFVGIMLIEGIGAALLALNWMRFMPPGQAIGYAIFHSISAFCNAGFDLFTGLPGYEGIPADNFSLLTMGSLIFIGGLGIPVLSDFFTHKLRFRFSLHTRLTLHVVFALTLISWIGIFLSEAVQPGVLSAMPLDEQLVRSLFQSVSNRTAGFAGLPDFNALAPATILLIVCMMFVGCAPASMGGGITTGTLVVLLVALRSSVRGLPNARVRGRRLSRVTVRRAGAVLTVATILLALGMWLIMVTNSHLTFDQVFFEVVSAFATCGLSLGATTEFNWFGRLIIMMMMFWGRLGTLTIVIAMVQRSDPSADLVEFPEAQVLIG